MLTLVHSKLSLHSMFSLHSKFAVLRSMFAMCLREYQNQRVRISTSAHLSIYNITWYLNMNILIKYFISFVFEEGTLCTVIIRKWLTEIHSKWNFATKWNNSNLNPHQYCMSKRWTMKLFFCKKCWFLNKIATSHLNEIDGRSSFQYLQTGF